MQKRRGMFHGAVRRRGWMDRSSGAPLSNVLMDGGCLYVPDTEYRDFLDLCARCADDGEPIYVVERPSDDVRFYGDIDAHLPLEADVDAFVDALAVAFCMSANAYMETSSPTVVLCAEPKQIDATSQKIGIHLVMPHTKVRDAGAVRDAVMRDIACAATLATPLNSWEDAFDKSVYSQGGLRLVGCRKMVPCGCAANSQCTHMMRKVDAGRPYLFRHVVGPDGAVDATWTNKLRVNATMRTLMSSIRLPGSRADHGQHKKQKRPRGAAGPSSSTSWRVADMVDVALEAPLGDLGIVSTVGAGARRLLHVDGESGRYCPNVQRQHKQSTIYFVVHNHTMAMRCLCKKGTCPTFRGPEMPLSRHGARVLGVDVSENGLPPGFV